MIHTLIDKAALLGLSVIGVEAFATNDTAILPLGLLFQGTFPTTLLLWSIIFCLYWFYSNRSGNYMFPY